MTIPHPVSHTPRHDDVAGPTPSRHSPNRGLT